MERGERSGSGVSDARTFHNPEIPGGGGARDGLTHRPSATGSPPLEGGQGISRISTDRQGSPHDRGMRVNEQIRISPVRLVGANGEQLGIVPTSQALDLAREANLDLVEVAANERPP